MPGLKVQASQQKYPLALSNSELVAHKIQLDEYKQELSVSLYETALNYKPDLSLIHQQPEIKQYLREPLLQFLLKISLKTKVTNGIFFQAAKVFDRYCSKRIVLKDQAQLVLATCLWLSAKTYGGCNHIINNTNVPTGGRFYGPNPRARIPRLSELVQLCGGGRNASGDSMYDEGMFIQMERHILDTLNWDVCEPQLNNWLLNFYENNLIQFEVNNEDMEEVTQSKIELIYLKRFLAEISLFEMKTVELHPAHLAKIIFNLLTRFYPNLQLSSDIVIPEDSITNTTIHYFTNLLVDKILNLSDWSLSHYLQYPGVKNFYELVLSSYIRSDSTSSSLSTSSLSINEKLPLTPINSPSTSKLVVLPTPPSSRRGSPANIFDAKPIVSQPPPPIGFKFLKNYTPPPLMPLE